MDKVTEDRGITCGWKAATVLFTVAVSVRVAAMLVLQSWEFKSDWAFGHEMGRLGRSLAMGHGFVLSEGGAPTAGFPPLYPLVVAGFFSVFGVYSQAAAVGLFLFQSACAGLSAVFLANIGARLVGLRAGLIAGSLWALYPTSMFYSIIRVWYCELALTLMLGAVLMAIAARSPAGLPRTAAFGALSGLIVLIDSTLSVYLALLLFWMLLRQGARGFRLGMLYLAGGIAVSAVAAPWALHNWHYLGSPRIVKSNFGQALFIGNNPLAEGKTNRKERTEAYTTLDPAELGHFKNQPELVSDELFLRKAVEWIQHHPGRFAWLSALRVYAFWIINPTLGRDSWQRFLYFGPLLALALYSLWAESRRRWQLAPLWMFMLVYPLPFYVTHVSAGRYSYPIEPFVVLLAAIPLAAWFGSGGAVLSFSRAGVKEGVEVGRS